MQKLTTDRHLPVQKPNSSNHASRVFAIGALLLGFFSAQAAWPQSADTRSSDEAYQAAASAYLNQNMVSAETQFGALADEGNASAQYALAVMHLKNEASNPSPDRAFALLKQAAQQSHLAAMFNLGVMYWEGVGTQANSAEAVHWWQRGAEAGDSGAQFNLAMAYYRGKGAEQNNEQALHWASRSNESGHPEAAKLKGAVEWEIRNQSRPTEIASTDTPETAATEVTPQETETAAANQDSERITSSVVSLSPTTSGESTGAGAITGSTDNPLMEAVTSVVNGIPTELDAQPADIVTQSTMPTGNSIVAPPSAPDDIRPTEATPAPADRATETETAAIPTPPKPQPVKDWKQHWQKVWQVGFKPAPLRAQPSTEAVALKTLDPGTRLTVFQQDGDWLQVTVPDNYPVWIWGKFVRGEASQAQIKGTQVNVRPVPMTGNNQAEAAPVGQLNTGDALNVLDTRDGWVRAVPEKSLPAWILTGDANEALVSIRETQPAIAENDQNASTPATEPVEVAAADESATTEEDSAISVSSLPAAAPAQPTPPADKVVINAPASDAPKAHDSDQKDAGKTENQLVERWQSGGQVATLRARPNTSAVALKTLEPGTPLKFIQRRGDWLQVTVPGNFPVWVWGKYVQGEADQARITGDNVNARPITPIESTSDLAARPVGQLNSGDTLSIRLKRQGWVNAIPKKALPGWVHISDVNRTQVSQSDFAQSWARFSQ